MDIFKFKTKNILPDEIVDQLADYWCDPSGKFRNENLGEFIQRVAEIGAKTLKQDPPKGATHWHDDCAWSVESWLKLKGDDKDLDLCDVCYRRKRAKVSYGYFREDESGHDYVIPAEKIEDFDSLLGELYDAGIGNGCLYEDICVRIDNDFSKYKVEGGLYNMKILMED